MKGKNLKPALETKEHKPAPQKHSKAKGTVVPAEEVFTTTGYRQWADQKERGKPRRGGKRKNNRKLKKKCYCCNPYSLWCCRDYPSAVILAGIAAIVVIIWIILYELPVTEEQECPLVEVSNCDSSGLLCDPYGDPDDENTCEEDVTCERIIKRIVYNGRTEDSAMFCGNNATCMHCVNADDTLSGNPYDIQVTRCGYHNTTSGDLEGMANLLGYEYYYAQDFLCSDHQITMLAAAKQRKDEATSTGNFFFLLVVTGAVIYYLHLLQGYSKFTGKPRLKWAFSGEFLKPRPKCLRQHKKGQAPILGANLDMKTHYKDLFKHPWKCFICNFEVNDPGTEKCEVCGSRNPNLPDELMPWEETNLGQLTLGKLKAMLVPDLEKQLLALIETQARRRGGVMETDRSDHIDEAQIESLDAENSDHDIIKDDSDHEVLQNSLPTIHEVKAMSKRQIIEFALSLLGLERKIHERKLSEEVAQRKLAEQEQRRRRSQIKAPKYIGVALGPVISHNAQTVAVFQLRYDKNKLNGVVGFLATKVVARAKKDLARTRSRMSHASSVVKKRLTSEGKKLKSKLQRTASTLKDKVTAEASKVKNRLLANLDKNDRKVDSTAKSDSTNTSKDNQQTNDTRTNKTEHLQKDNNTKSLKSGEFDDQTAPEATQFKGLEKHESRQSDEIINTNKVESDATASQSGLVKNMENGSKDRAETNVNLENKQSIADEGDGNETLSTTETSNNVETISRRFQQSGQYIFLRGDAPDRYHVTRVRIHDWLRFTSSKPFAYKPWQIGKVEVLRAAPTSHAAASLTADGTMATFLSHLQIIRYVDEIETEIVEDTTEIGDTELGGEKHERDKTSEEGLNQDRENRKPAKGASTTKSNQQGNEETKKDFSTTQWSNGAEGPSGPGWEVALDPESGHQYEFNESTTETRWIEAVKIDQAQPDVNASYSLENDDNKERRNNDAKLDTVQAKLMPAKQRTRKCKMKRTRVVLRAVCNAVTTRDVGQYLWSTPLQSDMITVPASVNKAEAAYRKKKLAQTGTAVEDSTDDAYSPLRKFEVECLEWLQTPVLSASGRSVIIRTHNVIRVIDGRKGTMINDSKHFQIVEIDCDVKPVLSDNGRRAAARTDGGIVIWDVKSGDRRWMWHHPETSDRLTLVDDEITALTGGVKAWEGGVVAAHASTRPVVPDPGALRAFSYWAKLDAKGEKPMSIVRIALRLADLRAQQRQLWPCPPVMSGDGRIVAFRLETRLYIVDSRKRWESTKSDDGSGENTAAFKAVVELGSAPVSVPERTIGISQNANLICVLVSDGAMVHAYNSNGGEPLWVHKTPNRLMGPSAPLVSRDGSIVAFKLWESFVILNGSDGQLELTDGVGDVSGVHQSPFELACCCCWRRGKLRRTFVGTQEPWERGGATGNLSLPSDGSLLLAKSGENILCFNIPDPYRENRFRGH